MGPEGLLIFVGIIVGACIAGGAIYAGLCRVAEAIKTIDHGKQRDWSSRCYQHDLNRA